MEKGNNEAIRTSIDATCEAFENVLKIKPDCKQAFLYLIDIYGLLPNEFGGNKEKAENLVKSLGTLDDIYGARGKLIILQETVKETDYWEEYITNKGENDEVLELLGKAYLMADDPLNAEKCFAKVINNTPSKAILLLDVARLYIMHIMQQIAPAETELPKVKDYIFKYLNSGIEIPISVKAWCYGILSHSESILGNNDQANNYLQKANSLDANFSRAFAVPSVDYPPDEMVFVYKSYFKPF